MRFAPIPSTYAVMPRGYKVLLMLNSTEHEIYSAPKYKKSNNCLLLNLYEQDKFNI